jgi:SAM-dependent methyltransferase
MRTTTTREEEIQVYEKAYQSRSYRMGGRRMAHVQDILRDLVTRHGEGKSLLDVGTGRHETLTFAGVYGMKGCMGTEVVRSLLVDGLVVYAEAHHLPFEDGSFDHVTCFDVLEHLIEDDIRPALREMYRVARITCTVSASEQSSIHNGRELHISRRPKAQWLTLIQECWPGAVCIGNAGASPAFQVIKG